MSVTEAQRLHLYETLKSTIGEQDADTFMNLTPSIEWSNLATKDDVHAVKSDIHAVKSDVHTLEQATNARFDTLESDIYALRQTTNARFDTLEQTTNARFEAVNARFTAVDQRLAEHDKRFDRVETKLDNLQQDVAAIRPELQRTLGTWIFASQAAVVTIITILLAIMR